MDLGNITDKLGELKDKFDSDGDGKVDLKGALDNAELVSKIKETLGEKVDLSSIDIPDLISKVSNNETLDKFKDKIPDDLLTKVKSLIEKYLKK